jgi:iron complex outermembrane receptor protein
VDRANLILARWCLVAGIAAASLCATASAQTRAVVIPEQPLSQALKLLGQQTGVNILFTPASVEGLRAHAVSGQMTAQQAVNDMLQGTGLVARTDGHALLIERMPRQTPDRLASQSTVQGDATALQSQIYAGPIEQVIVSSTRITSNSFNAPTPTTVLTANDIDRTAEPNVFDTVVQLPSLEGSTGPDVNTNNTSTGLNGLSSFGLRGLGTIRTLVLLDGQRVAPANVSGVVDISQLPQLLIQRIDVVTGGASASWGSDAVAGVVNFVTDKKFSGIRANLLAGVSTYGDDPNVTAQLAYGGEFDGGRGHIEISSEYSFTAGLNPVRGVNGFGVGPGQGIGGRNWNVDPAIQMLSIAATPFGQPQYSYGVVAQSDQFAKFGLITSGPLQGAAFGSSGVPFSFIYGSNGIPAHDANGTVVGCANSICFGGDTSAVGINGTTLADTLTRANVYTRASYDLNHTAAIYFTMNLSNVWSLNIPNSVVGKNANLTIQCDNPFLPPTIVAQCASNGITSFQYGTANADFPNFINVRASRDQRRFVIGADGTLSIAGEEWTWDSYLEHGLNNTSIHVRDMSLTPRYDQAIDAVRAADGSIVCRSAVARASGCVPLDVIGDVPLDPAAIAYVIPANGPYQLTGQRQEVLSASANGAPWQDWAGQVSIALGFEYREEAYRVRADPYGNGVTPQNPNTPDYPVNSVLNVSGNNWYAGNFHDASGNYHVTEAFLEAAVPLLDKNWTGLANLELAGRITGYSTSGQSVTWKAGITWDLPVDGLRLRALQSRDVRSPNLSELFAANVTTNASVTNDFTGNNVTILNVATGNTSLRPERAQTTELGFVVQPSWLPGFSSTIDYYRIAVKGEIASLTAQQEVDLCYNGNEQMCNAIVTTNNGPPQTSPFSQVIAKLFNLASAVTDGFDVEVNYHASLEPWALPGELNLRLLANHTTKFITDPGIAGEPPEESAGNMTLGASTANNVPLWKLLAIQSYDLNGLNTSITERWISDGVFNKMYVECSNACPLPTLAHPTINYNRQPGALYLDIGVGYQLSSAAQFYMKIDNVANISPPPSPSISAPSYGVNPALYDVIGRMFRAGVRITY